MAIYDIIDAQDRVVNRIVLDEPSAWSPPEGHTIRVSDGSPFGDPPAPVEVPSVFPNVISDRQFFHALALQQLITKEEAMQAVRVGAIPATLQAFVDANLTGDDKFAAEMLLSGAVEFRRDHPLTAALGVGLGWSRAQIDDLWRSAAQL